MLHQLDIFGNAILERSQPETLFSEEEIVDLAYDWYTKNGFPYPNLPRHACMQEINKLYNNWNNDALQNSISCMEVANSYHPQRYAVLCNGKYSPLTAFSIPKKLKKALRKDLISGKTLTRYPSFLSIVSGVQAAANFRPAYAAYIYRKYAKVGNTILDTSAGFGGRLVGFIASGINGKYIGIDPATETQANNIKLFEDLGKNIFAEFICSPSEDVKDLPKCDLAFTSPPYFNREIYSQEETQSCHRYLTPNEWKENFLRPTIQLQFDSLKNNSYNILNIANIKYKNTVLPLETWTTEIAKEVGFELINIEWYNLRSRIGSGNDGSIAREPVFVFKKP